MTTYPPPGLSIAQLPKSWTFTAKLPADPAFPDAKTSHATPREQIGPRQVRGALFSYVRPESAQDPDVLAVSPAALKALHIDPETTRTDDFVHTVAGNRLHGWNDAAQAGGYPWAQCYGGFQFGAWAGQLGDGRAISLFETTNPETRIRHEVQLKGAGLTPYSRFADGRAVLRSSIREFLASEALHALGIPTTRALALASLPHVQAVREAVEPCAIVTRFAPSWIRLGTFDLPRVRADMATVRALAEYVAEEVYGGWDALPGRLDEVEAPTAAPLEEPRTGVAREAVEGPEGAEENRFARLYRAVVRRNAAGCAAWQVYGFMNGVLNTDNTSILGLSMDYGPFAFMDVFNPQYTPNHDDVTLRYSYRNQPTVIWWNLVRFGEALAHLMGAAARVDDADMQTKEDFQANEDAIIPRAEKLIGQAGEEYKAVFTAEYHRLMLQRLGLQKAHDDDVAEFIPEMLDALAECKVDFHGFFRALSEVSVGDLGFGPVSAETVCSLFSVKPEIAGAAKDKLANWLTTWRDRIVADWAQQGDEKRIEAMKKVNPKFVLRGWILSEVIRRVQVDKDRDVLRRITHMALHPFEDSWAGREFDGKVYEGDRDEEERWTGPVPETEVALQCSCSS